MSLNSALIKKKDLNKINLIRDSIKQQLIYAPGV